MPSSRAHPFIALAAVACMLGCPPGPEQTTTNVSLTSDPDESDASSSTTGPDATSTTDDSTTTADPAGSDSESSVSATMADTSTASSSSETTAGEPECGNGKVEGDEECDDGNKLNGDECLNVCLFPYCGDGIHREDKGEECDDGDDDDSDGCNTLCARDRHVFLTSETRQGNFGAVSGANSRCKTLAANAGLDNADTFRAWMSDDTHNPSDWFFKSKGRYVMTNGDVVADDWDDLTDGTIQNPIQIDENGEFIGSGLVWSNTTPAGLRHPDSHDCMGWGTLEFPVKGRIGKAWSATSEWTDAETNNPSLCAGDGRFYCFEN